MTTSSAQRWQCALLLASPDAAAALGPEAAALVDAVCREQLTGEEAARRACPAVPPDATRATMPALPAAALLTPQGHAAAALFREVCAADVTTLPWACGPPRGIVDAAMCMHQRASADAACALTADDLYGADLAGYENAARELKRTNPMFYGFACEASQAPQPGHRLMCSEPLDLAAVRAANPRAAEALGSLHQSLCGGAAGGDAGPSDPDML
jgi:hypothetical protein